MSISYGGTNITFPDASTQNTSPKTGFVNRIINGGMVINQRSFSGTPANGAYTLDRWSVNNSAAKFTVSQSSIAPAGFNNSLLVTSNSSYSVPAGEIYTIGQAIEAYNVNDLAWGTSSAQTIAISFWVRSSLTGTFGGALFNASINRSYPFTYSIAVANTWSYITLTIAGDQSGTWAGTNGAGIYVQFGLGVGTTYSSSSGSWQSGFYFSATGATSVVGTSGATFYITGVQLEKGSTATPFEFRAYGQELALCQRYYFKDPTVASLVYNGSGSYSSYQFKVTMRAAPTVTTAYATGAASENGFYALSGGVTGSSVIASAEL